METVKDWNRALLYTGQNIKPEDMIKYGAQLREVDRDLLERNVSLAEEVSGLPISRYLALPMDISSDNAAVQMVVHTLNVTSGDLALAKIAQTKFIDRLVGAGLSLGEGAVLDAAGVFPSRRSGMEFVFTRGTNMQRAYENNPGSLYMIEGLTEEQLDEISLDLEVATALINAPTLIIVGSTQGRTDIEELARAAGAKKVTDFHLPPFHTLYMDEARLAMMAFNRNLEYRTAQFPVVSNLDGKPSRRGLLLIDKHIANFVDPVRWDRTIATIYHEGVMFYTMGPGNNLAVLNRLNGVPKEQTKDLFQLLAE